MRALNEDSCQLTSLSSALDAFSRAEVGVQGARHIKPLHWHIACRLVLEGGFHPDLITPHPPFSVRTVGSGSRRRNLLIYEEYLGRKGEQTILGGLKTKAVDVVVSSKSVGPSVAVSLKGTINAFRNLTNRMEEAVGDCTNIHITYPALVYGFLHLIRANKEGPIPNDAPPSITPDNNGQFKVSDIALRKDGSITSHITKYHDALVGLASRKGVRDDITRYESVALVLVESTRSGCRIYRQYPENEDLNLDYFFDRIYLTYDERFVYSAPDLASAADPLLSTSRLFWDLTSDALEQVENLGFKLRISE